MEGQALGAVLGIGIAIVIIGIFVFVFRWLWNSTMPEVFGFKELSFGQSLKILILASILFGGHRVVELPQELAADSVPATTAAS